MMKMTRLYNTILTIHSILIINIIMIYLSVLNVINISMYFHLMDIAKF